MSLDLRGKYIICACEGNAEKAIMEILLDAEALIFRRSDVIDGECIKLRTGEDIARAFLGREYERDISIVRILDREKERFNLPPSYSFSRKIEVCNVVTKPEIEILHIYAAGLTEAYEHAKKNNKGLKPSEFCKGYFGKKAHVKSEEFVRSMYEKDVEKLIAAIKKVEYHPSNCFVLSDLLLSTEMLMSPT